MVKTKDKKKNVATGHPVRLAYQPPCSFGLSATLFSFGSSATNQQ
jgi:hypothetical protein